MKEGQALKVAQQFDEFAVRGLFINLLLIKEVQLLAVIKALVVSIFTYLQESKPCLCS